MNTANIIGRLTNEIELRYTPSGKAVANFTVAVDDGFGDQKRTLWIAVTAWGQQAEALQKHAMKGQKLGITGRISQEEYTPQGSDKPVRKTGITLTGFDFLERPKGQEESRATGQSHRPAGQQGGQRPQPAPAGDYHEEDDIPF
jgi:single-strand DNA-binding protein